MQEKGQKIISRLEHHSCTHLVEISVRLSRNINFKSTYSVDCAFMQCNLESVHYNAQYDTDSENAQLNVEIVQIPRLCRTLVLLTESAEGADLSITGESVLCAVW